MTSDTVCIATDLELKSKAESLRESINCLENNLNEIELERKRRAEQPEFRFLQPVLDDDGDKAYFLNFDGSDYQLLDQVGVNYYASKCIPDPEATTRINWIDYKGTLPAQGKANQSVWLKYRNGEIIKCGLLANQAVSDIIAYAVIED
jgi:hypothetical protein